MSDLSDWPALILTAGVATRLRVLSAVRAKAALPVAGRPLIARIIQWLREAGVRRVVLNLHHRPETVTRVVGHGVQWGVEARYSWEPVVLGSAGGPKRALPLVDAERFLIINGDTLTDCDLEAVAAQHLESQALVTMAVVPGDVQRYGGVMVDAGGAVEGFGKGHGALHFIGVQAVTRGAFDGVSDSEPSETVAQLYPQLIERRRGSIRAYVSSASFLDIGTPADYFRTVDLVAAAEQVPLDRGAGCVIDPSATVSHSILWDRVTVGEQAKLIDCIVADDVTVPAGARYERSAIVASEEGLIVEPL